MVRLLDGLYLRHAAVDEGIDPRHYLETPFYVGWFPKGGGVLCWAKYLSVEAAVRWMARHNVRHFRCGSNGHRVVF